MIQTLIQERELRAPLSWDSRVGSEDVERENIGSWEREDGKWEKETGLSERDIWDHSHELIDHRNHFLGYYPVRIQQKINSI